MTDLQAVAKEVKSLKTDQELRFNKLMEILTDIQSSQANIQENLKEMATRVENVESTVAAAQSEIVALQNENAILQSEMRQFEQACLVTSFNVFGFPTMKQEEALNVMIKIGSKIGSSMNKNDFKDLYVNNHRNKTTSNIVGTFYDQRKRDDVFARIKKTIADKKPLLVEDYCTLASDSTLRGTEIRIKTKLTQNTRKLLAYARLYNNTFKFIWETNGRVLVKKDEQAKTIEIKSEQQLRNIGGGSPRQMDTS